MTLWLKAFSGFLALICENDIDIDKVNKPYLPIATGDLSVQSAWFLGIVFLLS